MSPARKARIGINTVAVALVSIGTCSWLGYGWAQTTSHIIGWVLLAVVIVALFAAVIVSQRGERSIREDGDSR